MVPRLLDDRVVLVTGAASGIGAAAARLAADEGARVVLTDLDSEGLDRVAAEIGPGQAVAVPADIANEGGARRGVEAALREFGRLDGAVNSAGLLGPPARIAETSFEEWRRVAAVDLDGLFLCVRAQVEPMVERGAGSIVNVASGAGITGAPGSVAYAASKHGVVGLTRSVAREYPRRGVRANVVCPSMIETPLLDDLFAKGLGHVAGLRDRAEARQPMGRFGRPEEVAEAIVWLLSDRASFVNGVALPVDGGVLAAP